jgi:hypothetical protein
MNVRQTGKYGGHEGPADMKAAEHRRLGPMN